VGAPDLILQAAFFVSAVARTLYTIPSGYNGVFGRPRQHDLLIIAQIALLGLLAGTIVLLLGRVELVYLVAISGASNWALRTAIGAAVAHLIVKSKASV
jgi:hypothetical protein